jgi:hypothetical protein
MPGLHHLHGGCQWRSVTQEILQAFPTPFALTIRVELFKRSMLPEW